MSYQQPDQTQESDCDSWEMWGAENHLFVRFFLSFVPSSSPRSFSSAILASCLPLYLLQCHHCSCSSPRLPCTGSMNHQIYFLRFCHSCTFRGSVATGQHRTSPGHFQIEDWPCPHRLKILMTVCTTSTATNTRVNSCMILHSPDPQQDKAK